MTYFKFYMNCKGCGAELGWVAKSARRPNLNCCCGYEGNVKDTPWEELN